MFKKTKIVATIGPASCNEPTLKKLIQSGLNVARFNFSHGTNEDKEVHMKLVRSLSEELDQPVTILADISGPKLRLGEIDGVRQIKKGEQLNLSLYPIGDELPIQFDLTPFVKKNQRIFLNDGLVELKVTSVTNKIIKTVSQNSGWVSTHKGVNIPDTLLKGRAFTEKDMIDIEFSLSQNVDYLALSFIQTPQDILKIREKIKKAKSKTKIITKLEKPEAIKNLEAIIKVSDALMVARGDLGIEMDAAEVPVVQQRIIRLARQYQKPVIVATQMLESMIENPRPTRAEVSDVGNAVLDQVDAVMLSAESASGKYPVEAVSTMKDVITAVEAHPDYKNYIKIDWTNMPEERLTSNGIVSAAASLAYRIHAKGLIVTTATGKTAELLASFRPDAPIIAITHDIQTCGQLNLIWNVYPMIISPSSQVDTFIERIIQTIKEEKLVAKGDHVVVVTGAVTGTPGMIDRIKVVTI